MGITNTYLRQKVLVSAEEFVKLAAAAANGLAGVDNGHAPSAPASAGGDVVVPSAPAALPDVEVVTAKKDADGGDVTPSAPAMGAEGATAPPPAPVTVVDTFKSTECVICLANKVIKPPLLCILVAR